MQHSSVVWAFKTWWWADSFESPNSRFHIITLSDKSQLKGVTIEVFDGELTASNLWIAIFLSSPWTMDHRSRMWASRNLMVSWLHWITEYPVLHSHLRWWIIALKSEHWEIWWWVDNIEGTIRYVGMTLRWILMLIIYERYIAFLGIVSFLFPGGEYWLGHKSSFITCM